MGFDLGFGLALGLAAFASVITGTGIGSVELTRGVNFAVVGAAVTVGVSEIDLAAERGLSACAVRDLVVGSLDLDLRLVVARPVPACKLGTSAGCAVSVGEGGLAAGRVGS